jgi:hypothetical protein
LRTLERRLSRNGFRGTYGAVFCVSTHLRFTNYVCFPFGPVERLYLCKRTRHVVLERVRNPSNATAWAARARSKDVCYQRMYVCMQFLHRPPVEERPLSKLIAVYFLVVVRCFVLFET